MLRIYNSDHRFVVAPKLREIIRKMWILNGAGHSNTEKFLKLDANTSFLVKRHVRGPAFLEPFPIKVHL